MKQLLRYILQTLKYRNVDFAISSVISRDCEFSGPGKIEEGAKMLASKVGSGYWLGAKSICSNIITGINCRFENNALITNSKFDNFIAVGPRVVMHYCEVGSHSYLAQEVLAYHVKIGNYCSIGPRVIFGHGDHPVTRLSSSPEFYTPSSFNGHSYVQEVTFEEFSPILVGHDVWIGANAYVKHGVNIGNGAIIAAGAVVTRDVSPYSIVGGVPAKELKKRFSTPIIEQIERLEWWKWDEEKIRQHLHIFKKEEITLEDLEQSDKH